MENFFIQLRNNWVILIAIVSMIVWSANVNARLAHAEKERDEIFALLGTIHEIEISLAVIEEKISTIETKLQ